uniref:Hyaluronan mediated motility receptor isoform X2 n=1 Tax=Geotrypetes seraphini TaxID=260995 RepID=A0A6P8R121_GEOSA|nr:hyaluronan mediated motility receptor isoform X2 [Geotrypetes seraphini]
MKEGDVCGSAPQQEESEKALTTSARIHKHVSLGSTFSDDGTKKKISSLCMELMETKTKMDARDKEFSFLQFNLEGQIKVLQVDLEASQATMIAMQERNKSLEDICQYANLHNEDLEKELDKLHALVEDLRKENILLQGYLADAQDQIQTLTSKVEEMEEQLQKVQKNLEHSLEEATQLEEKLIAADQEKDKVVVKKTEVEKKLMECREEIGEVSAQAEKYKLILGQSEDRLKQKDLDISTIEEELSKQIKELNIRCQSNQQEKENLLNEGQVKEQNLNTELQLLKEKLNQDQQNLKILNQTRETLISLLKEEEVVSNSLRQELSQLPEEMLKERGLLEEELEGALDELDRLQLEEVQAEKFIAQLEEENKLHGEELAQLQTKLNDYKVSVTEEIERLKMKNSFLVEKATVTEKAVEDTRQHLQELKMAKDKTEEEYARLLLDAQTKLAGKEAEMKKSLESHLVKTTEFQSLIEEQNESIKKYLEEIERLRKEAVNDERIIELREEICTWRTLYEDLHNKIKPFQDVSRLRSQLAKERQAGKKLQEQLNAMQDIHRFDPSKAFQHDSKENMVPKTPLKDGNRNK